MAARRLLIVMLVLLGISTLAAALVPQRTLREDTTGTTTTQPTTTTPPPSNPTVRRPTKILVGPKKFPLVRAHVGDQFTLLVRSLRPREISIPEFGLLGFATTNTPARFELLTSTPGTFGILFAATGKAAAQIEVVSTSAEKTEKKKGGKKAKSRARAGSSRA